MAEYIKMPFYTTKVQRQGAGEWIDLHDGETIYFGDSVRMKMADRLDFADDATVRDKKFWYSVRYEDILATLTRPNGQGTEIRLGAAGTDLDPDNYEGQEITAEFNDELAYNAFRDAESFRNWYHYLVKGYNRIISGSVTIIDKSAAVTYPARFPEYSRAFQCDLRFYDVWGRQCLGRIASINGSTVTLEENSRYAMGGGKVLIAGEEYALASAVSKAGANVVLTEEPAAEAGDYVYNAKAQRLTDEEGFTYEEMAAHGYKTVINTYNSDEDEIAESGYSVTVTFNDDSRTVTIGGIEMTSETSPACYVKRIAVTGPNCNIVQTGSQVNPVEGKTGDTVYSTGRIRMGTGSIDVTVTDDNNIEHTEQLAIIVPDDVEPPSGKTVPLSLLQAPTFTNINSISVLRASADDGPGGVPVVLPKEDCTRVRIAGIGRDNGTVSYDQYADITVAASYRLQGGSFTGNYALTESGDSRGIYGFIMGDPTPVEPNEVCMVRLTVTDSWGQQSMCDIVSPQVMDVENPVVWRANLSDKTFSTKWKFIPEGGLYGIVADKDTNTVYLSDLNTPGFYLISKTTTTVYDNAEGGDVIQGLHRCGVLVVGDGDTFGYVMIFHDDNVGYGTLTKTGGMWHYTVIM